MPPITSSRSEGAGTARVYSDVIVVGAGAAGLATAIFAARAGAGRVLVLEGARRVGAKILVSGGGRCNVTNVEVTERDFWGGSRRAVREVLRAFPADRAREFFAGEGVALHEEEDGKLFPDTNRARDVVDALLRAATAAGVEVLTGCRVQQVSHAGPRVRPDRGHLVKGGGAARDAGEGPFEVTTAGHGVFAARAVVLATGGRSLPKSGSDGFGYTLAQALGHSVVETTPALAPLIVEDPACARLAGVAHVVELRVRAEGRTVVTLRGALLWTHFGISGPVALNASRHWLRARLGAAHVDLVLNVLPGGGFESVERWLLSRQRDRPRALVSTVLAEQLPQAVAEAWLERAGLDRALTMSHLARDARRQLVHALVATTLAVRDSRGYSYAEVTAGGIPLSEVDTATMQSRRCSGLYLVGEILDVDGRLGGFNFQWAWSSAWVAAQGIATALGERERARRNAGT